VAYNEHRPRTPPPDLPSMLLDGRIVYIGMPVSYVDSYGFFGWDCIDWWWHILLSACAGSDWASCRWANVSSVAGSQGTHLHLHQLHRDHSWWWRDGKFENFV